MHISLPLLDFYHANAVITALLLVWSIAGPPASLFVTHNWFLSMLSLGSMLVIIPVWITTMVFMALIIGFGDLGNMSHWHWQNREFFVQLAAATVWFAGWCALWTWRHSSTHAVVALAAEAVAPA
jgi:hypothetical protein